MAFHVVEEIRKKSRESWTALLTDRWSNVRVWIQENGELAFLLGLSLGFLVVFFFELVVGLCAISFIIGFSVYQLSYPEDELASRSVESVQSIETDKSTESDKSPDLAADEKIVDEASALQPSSNGTTPAHNTSVDDTAR